MGGLGAWTPLFTCSSHLQQDVEEVAAPAPGAVLGAGWGAGCGPKREGVQALTGGAPVEVVVVLGHVGQNAQPVGHLQGHHVLGVQQGRDAQLLLSHAEGLGGCGQRGGLGGPSPTSARPPAPTPPLEGRWEGPEARMASLASVYPSVPRRVQPNHRIEGALGPIPVGPR